MIKNPQQAQQMLLQQIANKNPDLAHALTQMQNSGVPANEAMRNMIQNGQLDKATFDKARDMYNTYGRFLPFTVDNSDWDMLSNEFNPQQYNNQGSNNFRF